MEFKTLLFYIFAAVTVLAALRVITARNPVHAVLFLVLAFFNVAGLWMLLQAEFLALALIMVYVGAVMVLFLFVVMMLDINIERVRQGFWSNLPLGALVGGLMVAEMAVVLSGALLRAGEPAAARSAGQLQQHQGTGRVLYTDYAYPFEIASVILLVAIIAAVMLTLRKRKENKAMHASDQIAVKAKDRMRLVKMAPEVELPASSQGRGTGMISLSHYLILAAILFAISIVGIFLNRKNLIVLLMAIELMLLAVNINFVAFSHYLNDLSGQLFVFFILTVAAAESGIGLAILVVLFRNLSSIDVEDLDSLKG
jgi:NADH-quinone oxidoreductase subunit J